MDDTPITEMTNSELAFLLREGGHLVDASREALARLLEADAKNHDFIANQESKWRDMLAQVVLAYNAMMVQARPPEWNHSTYTPDFHYARVRYEAVIEKAEALIREGERHFTEPYPEATAQPLPTRQEQ